MEKKNLKFILLEDTISDQQLIKRQVLKFNSSSIFSIASNKKEFTEKLEWMEPDFILSDFDLPDMTGLDALLITNTKHPHIPFIFITGRINDEGALADAILKGADGYVLKENLEKIPSVLQQVHEKNLEKNKYFEELKNKIYQSKVRLLKLKELISNSKSIEHKETLHLLISEIENDLNEYENNQTIKRGH